MESKTILITGCSSGQGRNLAGNLTKAGYRVAATARKLEDLNDLSAELKLRLDVTDNDSIQAAVSKTIEKFGGLDILINNAGFAIRSAIEEAPEDLLRRMFDVNVFGNIRMVRAVAPHMRNRKSGMIITIGSLAGKVSLPVNGNYSMTKFALEAMSDALRLELGMFGIKVVLIEPGNINTQFKEKAVSISSSILNNESSVYAPLYATFVKLAAHSPSLEPAAVTQVVKEAIESPEPKARYLVKDGSHLDAFIGMDDAAKDAQVKQMMGV